MARTEWKAANRRVARYRSKLRNCENKRGARGRRRCAARCSKERIRTSGSWKQRNATVGSRSSGGEFRLPLLMSGIGFDAKSAVPINLMVSLVTLAFSRMVCSRTVSADAILPNWPEVVGLAMGGILSAFYGAQLVRRLASKHLVQIIAALLAVMGVLMLAEVIFAFQYVAILPPSPAFFRVDPGELVLHPVLVVAIREILARMIGSESGHSTGRVNRHSDP